MRNKSASCWPQPAPRPCARFTSIPESLLARTLGRDWKAKISLVSYAVAIVLAFVNRWISDGLFVMVAMLWLVPDRCMEKVLSA